MSSEGLLAVTDDGNQCVHLFSKEGALVRSIEIIGLSSSGGWRGIAFDPNGNVWVTEMISNMDACTLENCF